MTIDERAGEYANNIDYTKTVKMFDCVSYHENCDVADMVAQAFTDGFKEGLKQKVNITTISDCPIKDDWHDLRKDPEDLPNESSEIIREKGDKVYAIFKDNHYYFVDRAAVKHYEDLIAWCELPTFDKE